MRVLPFLAAAALLCACGPVPEPRAMWGLERGLGTGFVTRSGDISYSEALPAAGDHNAVPQRCGVYEHSLYPEHVLQSLAGGAVWAAYRPDALSAEDLARLKALAETHKLIVSPEPASEDALQLIAWGVRLRLPNASDARANEFLLQFTDQSSAPSRGRDCSKGTEITTSLAV